MAFRTTEQARNDLASLREERSRLSTEISRLAAVPGDLEAPERAMWLKATERVAEVNTAIEEAEGFLSERASRIDQLRAGSVSLDTGDGARGHQDHRDQMRSGVSHLRRVDPAEALGQARSVGLDSAEGARYALDAARASIDAWPERADFPSEWRESAARAAVDPRVAEHITLLSDERYIQGFGQYCRGGWGQVSSDIVGYCRGLNTDSERAMAEASPGGGGYMVPPYLDPALILTNVGISSPFRELSTIKTITTQVYKGISSAGVTAEWAAEAAEMADASPTVAQPTITPYRGDAYVQASFEMLEDTSLATDLAGLFADARDRLEGAAFAVGTGSTQPFGVVTSVAAVTTSRVAAQTAGAFGVVDVFALDNALPQRWRANASFVANRAILNLARQFAMGTGTATGAFWVDLGPNVGSTMLGYRVRESSAMAASVSTSSNTLLIGDFSQYYVVDRIGLSVVYLPLVLGANRRPTGEVGWACFWRTGGAPVNNDAFRVLIG
jgi:HK97 family phage major capsid protein